MEVAMSGKRLYRKGSRLAAEILAAGLTPKKLSLTLCLGIATGVMPILWGTSLLCAGFALLFRLNQAAIQAVNYCCYPLQIALFLPLYRLGARLFPGGPKVTGQALREVLHGHLGAGAGLFGWITVKALGAWLCTVVPLALFCYPFLGTLLAKKEAALAGFAKAAQSPVQPGGDRTG